MPERLILVRHSMTQQDPTLPSAEWRLSHPGRQACSALAETLVPFSPSLIVSSMEPKAIETAQLTAHILNIPSEIAVGLQEHDRSQLGFVQSNQRFEILIKELFDTPAKVMFGTECADQAHDRFSASLDHLLKAYPEDILAVVTHATVLSLFVAPINNLDTFEFWQALNMPEVLVLKLPDFELIQIAEIKNI